LKKRKQSKKWFDNECKTLKAEVRKLGRKKHTLPHDSFIREKYHENLKTFKKTCRSKKYFFLQDTLKQIEGVIDDSKSFWEKWKIFGDYHTREANIKLPGEKIYEHFSKLHNDAQENVITESIIASNKKMSSKPFSNKEFKEIIKNLKINKSEGYDCISSEMIKHSPDILLNIIHRFMHLCLEKSLVPKSCVLISYLPYTKKGIKLT